MFLSPPLSFPHQQAPFSQLGGRFQRAACFFVPRFPFLVVMPLQGPPPSSYLGQLIDSASTYTMGERKTNRSSNTNNNACHKGSGFRVISISGLFVSRNPASRFAWRHLSGFGFCFLFPDRDSAPLGKVPITSSLCFLVGGGLWCRWYFVGHICAAVLVSFGLSRMLAPRAVGIAME